MPSTAEPEIAPLATRAAAPTGVETLPFRSILFPVPEDERRASEPPDCFRDLNLDQIVASATAAFDGYDLAPFFFGGSVSLATVAWRHEVFRDLDDADLRQGLREFAATMRAVRQQLTSAEKSSFPLERARWFLDAAVTFADGLDELARVLAAAPLASRGLAAFRGQTTRRLAAPEFVAFANEARALQQSLRAIRFNLLVHGSTVTVRPSAGEDEYPAVIERTFARFRQRDVADYHGKLRPLPGMNHIDAQIVDRVAKLHPEAFDRLAAFPAAHANFISPEIAAFDREIQFYLCWLDHLDALRRAGLSFCLPVVSGTDKFVSARDTFDLALAAKLARENRPVVTNDLSLHGTERIAVVTGPNQGGKTTFARLIGQLHYLAGLGLPVPGRSVRLFLCDRIFTHFEREEDAATLQGKLQGDLVRARAILHAATPASLVVINEIFASTTMQDARWLSERILARLIARDALGVWVTFLDEMSRWDAHTASFVAGVAPDNPTERTFRIERRAADGRSYALALAAKYGLTTERLEALLSR